MEEKIKIWRGTLKEEDIDVLSGMMIIFAHSFEKLLQIVELHYEAEYRASKEYQYLVKRHGKAIVDNFLKKEVRNIVRGDKRNKFGKILKLAKEFHREMMSLTEHGMEAHIAEVSDADSLSAIVHDVNVLCYAYALMCNCPNDEDEVKLLSTLKIMAKGHRVSDNLMEKLKIQ